MHFHLNPNEVGGGSTFLNLGRGSWLTGLKAFSSVTTLVNSLISFIPQLAGKVLIY